MEFLSHTLAKFPIILSDASQWGGQAVIMPSIFNHRKWLIWCKNISDWMPFLSTSSAKSRNVTSA